MKHEGASKGFENLETHRFMHTKYETISRYRRKRSKFDDSDVGRGEVIRKRGNVAPPRPQVWQRSLWKSGSSRLSCLDFCARREERLGMRTGFGAPEIHRLVFRHCRFRPVFWMPIISVLIEAYMFHHWFPALTRFQCRTVAASKDF